MSGLSCAKKTQTDQPHFYAQCSRVTGMRDTKLRKGLRPTSAILATALYFSPSLANCGVLPRQTLFWNFCSRTLLFLPRGKLTQDSFSPLVEVEEVESPQSPAGTASSPLGCWGQTHIGNFCTGTREGRSPSSAPLSLMHSSVRRKGTALAWCWLF